MKKKTLYDRLLENFKEMGYEVEEGGWTEAVGYKKPTPEFWFDVTVSEEKYKYKQVLHYWFGSNKNKILSVDCWRVELKVVEGDTIKLF